MASAVGEALATWREAERLLDELPPLSPDHETVFRAVATARDTYHRLASATHATATTLATTRQAIEEARAVLEQVRRRRGA